MKILYISHLSQNIAAGMNWSVPASIRAQDKIDKVCWVNTNAAYMPHYGEVRAFHMLKDLGETLMLSVMPEAFRHPDVVVFEGLYFKEYLAFAKELRLEKIPYVIVPRGSMTHQALHNHARWKKFFAHLLYFNSFIRHAWRIQYLTQQESDDSTRRFRTPYFIVPNGVTMPSVKKEQFSEDGIHAVFIGRLDMYHKGLDLLLDAVTETADELRKANFTLAIYGPRRYDHQLIAEEIGKRAIGDLVSLNGEVSGSDKEQALLSADLFIMTSRFEGHPMGLIEALAYGLPCLVTPGTNMAEEIRDADAGWTCEGNVDDIVKTLLDTLNQKDLLPQKGKNARQLSMHYDWDKLAETFHDYITNNL